MSERKLATIQKISEIKPIPGADAIECARVLGWDVVVKKNEFAVGDLVLFLEIDSWCPKTLAPFLFKGRSYNGVEGERLRTVKLRGQLSQGLVLPIPSFEGDIEFADDYEEGIDFGPTLESLGMPIQKWEKPIPAQLQGMMKGNFPSFLRKTDQERVQNLRVCRDMLDEVYQVTIKLDGSSCTLYNREGEIGVCSRNVDLKMDQEGNSFVNMAKKLIADGLVVPNNMALQGELMGPGIQGNRENLKEHQFFVFDIWDIENQEYWPPQAVEGFCFAHKLNHVPVLSYINLWKEGLRDVDDIVAFASGKSLNADIREGLVFKCLERENSFKAISNEYLLKTGE